MPARIHTQPGSDAVVAPENSWDHRKVHSAIALAPASLVAVAALAAPLEVGHDRGVIVGKPALAQDGAASGDLRVMTFNQALGADLGSLLGEPPEEINAALVALLEDIVAANFRARAERQAELIARRLPDLVGLQEVWDLTCVDASSSDGEGCEHPSITDAFVDHLAVTLDALDALGLDYEAVAIVRNLETTTATLDSTPLGGIPFVIDGVGALLTSSDRDVILARRSTVIDPVPVEFACSDDDLKSENGCNYQAAAPVALGTPGGLLTLDFRRGFVAVDATVRGKDYRFVNTHLEIHEPAPGNPLSRFFQAAQAAELIATLETTPAELSLIVVGDMNSSPEHAPVPGIAPPYMQFLEAGYTDIWTLRPGAPPGFTCCQDPDLLNTRSKLSERIDMIFSLELPDLTRAQVVGADALDKTLPPGPRLWPSDHAGVAAGLRFVGLHAAAGFD